MFWQKDKPLLDVLKATRFADAIFAIWIIYNNHNINSICLISNGSLQINDSPNLVLISIP